MLEQHQGIVRCYDARTGKLHYQQRVPEMTGCTASPWVAGGKIFCLDEVGRTSVFESGPQFKLLATNRLDDFIAMGGDGQRRVIVEPEGRRVPRTARLRLPLRRTSILNLHRAIVPRPYDASARPERRTAMGQGTP